MAIAFDAASSVYQGEASTVTVPHTVGSGSNLALFVFVQWLDIDGLSLAAVSSVTYNGVSLSQISGATVRNDSTVDKAGDIWQLAAPATGLHDVVITMDSVAADLLGAACSFSGVHQTTLTGTPATATGSSSSPTLTFSSASNELPIAGLTGHGGFESPGDVTANDTEMWKVTTGLGMIAAGARAAGASSVTIDWTTAFSSDWAITGVSIKPAAAADDNGALSSDGAATANFTAASIASALLGMDGAATVQWVGIALTQGQGDFSMDGASIVQWVGASTGAAAIDQAGTGAANFVGTDGTVAAPAAPAAPVVSTKEGFFGAAKGRTRKRVQREDEEIIALLQKLGPELMKHYRKVN